MANCAISTSSMGNELRLFVSTYVYSPTFKLGTNGLSSNRVFLFVEDDELNVVGKTIQ